MVRRPRVVPAKPADQANLLQISRRSLVLGLPLKLAGVSALTFLASCSFTAPNPDSAEPTPEETPADIPDSLTPMPITTPTTPEITPTPVPTPTPEPVEQVLRVSGQVPGRSYLGLPAESVCGFSTTMSGLLRINGDFQPDSDWAESWAPLDEGEGWLFRLRENDSGWSGGQPITAHDFVAAWSRLLDPESGSSYAWLLYDIENAREVHAGQLPVEDLGLEAPDDWTLVVRLERERESFPALAASPFLAPFSGPAQELEDGNDCESTGPYRVELPEEEHAVLSPHAGYWDNDAASLERIEFESMRPASAIDAFRLNRLDIVRVDSADVVRVRGDESLAGRLYDGRPDRIICLVPQIDTPPFDDAGVRRALNKILDRRRLELIVEGRVVPARKLFPGGLLPPFDGASPTLQSQFDVDAAVAEIEESGYPDPALWPEFSLAVSGSDSFLERVARDVATQLNENLGLTVPVQVLEPDEYQEGLRERRFPLTWIDWRYRYPDPSCAYADLFGTWLNPDRPVVWEDQGYDELARLADAIADLGGRAEAYARCEELLQNQGVYIPLVHPVDYFLIQPWVQNVPTDSRGRLIQSTSMFTQFLSGVAIGQRP